MTDTEISRVFDANVPGWLKPRDRVLLVVPDTTRTAPLPRLLSLLLPVLRKAGARVTILIAVGTHPPLSRDVLRVHLGSAAFRGGVRIVNHAWNDQDALISVGALSADEVRDLSGGLLSEPVTLRLNREVGETDCMIFLHPVLPHEFAGFSGGSKYLFPGISGPEMIDIVHWLGALCTSGRVIGRIDTPSRRVLDAAAGRLRVPLHGLSFVYHEGEVADLQAGELRAAWRRAAAVSQRLHIVRKPRPFRKVLACCPLMYPDLWTGGKCVYKCEPVVADGGELIVYAPHARTFSEVHEATVKTLGYHVRDYFLANRGRYAGLPRAVMAYCTIVKGDGTYTDGIERPRIRVSFASRIPRSECEAAGIGYVDPSTIDASSWKNREDEGILCVEPAGEVLYRLEGDTADEGSAIPPELIRTSAAGPGA